MSNLKKEAAQEAVKNETTAAVRQLVIREGQAEPVNCQRSVDIQGNLSAPLEFLQKRANFINQHASHLVIDVNTAQMLLTVDEDWMFNTKVTGYCALNPDLQAYGINCEATWEPEQLAQHLRVNLHHFVGNREEGLKLVAALRNIRAKIDQQVEKFQNDKGSRRNLRDEVVYSNIPEQFVICLPLYGYFGKNTEIVVDVSVQPDTLNIKLVSSELKAQLLQALNDKVEEIIDEVRKVAPNLAIIYAQ